MKLIIEMIVEFRSDILVALFAVLGGFAYFFAIFFAKKYVSQFKNLRYLYASVPLIVINIFYLIVSIQQINEGMTEFAASFAFFILSLCATLIYIVLAVAVTANQSQGRKIKKTTPTKQR
jgi:surface polysaccharide O-acyltransferase-like enzyme